MTFINNKIKNYKIKNTYMKVVLNNMSYITKRYLLIIVNIYYPVPIFICNSIPKLVLFHRIFSIYFLVYDYCLILIYTQRAYR